MFGLSVTVAGTGPGVGGWVSGILNIPTPMGAPGPLQGRGFSHSWGCRSWAFTVPCCSFPTCGSGSGVTGSIRCVMCRLLRWAVEAFFTGRDLASGTCRTYRQALGPLVETVGSDRPVTSLDADQVAAVFEELWADRAPATWNTRRVAVQAFASWCGDRWPLAEDLLVGCRFGRSCCGGCCMRPPPERRRCWLSTWKISIGPGGGPGSAPRVAARTWLCGRRPPPACWVVTWLGVTPGLCS